MTDTIYVVLVHHEDERSGFIEGAYRTRDGAVAAAEAYTERVRPGLDRSWPEDNDLICDDVWVQLVAVNLDARTGD